VFERLRQELVEISPLTDTPGGRFVLILKAVKICMVSYVKDNNNNKKYFEEH